MCCQVLYIYGEGRVKLAGGWHVYWLYDRWSGNYTDISLIVMWVHIVKPAWMG